MSRWRIIDHSCWMASEGFQGTIIGGGTTAGVSGLIGAVQAAYPQSIATIGYVPASLPPGIDR